MRPWLGLGGPLMLFTLALTGGLGSVFMIGPVFPLLVLGAKPFRRVVDLMVSVWLAMVVAFVELILGVKVRVSGDCPQPGVGSVIIMNHRSRLDWLFYFCAMWRAGGLHALSREKIILKWDLKHPPGLGWAMQAASYLFLVRRWERDRQKLSDMLAYFREASDGDYHILIFPEGTDFEPNTIAASHRYADKMGLSRYGYVLHPRVTGFAHIVQRLREDGCKFGHVHDVTVGYPGTDPDPRRVPAHTDPKAITTSELAVVLGSVSPAVHFHTETIQVADLPSSEEGVREWCTQRWVSKERQLAAYYSHPTPQRLFDKLSASTNNNKNAAAVEGRGDGDVLRGNGTGLHGVSDAKGVVLASSGTPNAPLLCGVLAYWGVFVLSCCYALWCYWQVRAYVMVVSALYVGLALIYGGVDDWLCRLTLTAKTRGDAKTR